MKAVVYTKYGPPDVLHVKEVDKPVPKDNEVLIRVRAAAVNYGDIVARNFRNIPASKFNMPLLLWFPSRIYFGLRKPKRHILGNDFSGDIESVGKNVTTLKSGDPVFAYRGQKMGAYAEYVCMPADGMVQHKPSNMSYEEAAAIAYGGLMASSHLEKVEIKEGDNVLVNGASGGIGSMGVQLAKHAGAEVTGVSGTERLDMMRAIGADKVIDYTQEDFTQTGEKYDLIYDILGRSSFSRCKNSLTDDGRYLLASFKTGDLMQMIKTKWSKGKKVICAMAREKPENLAKLKEMAEAGKIKSVIDKTFPLEAAAEAHRYVESGQKKGHVIITV
jgi:NADPH:quinone reductase-like Zn-dependent oxidoreductase